MNRKTVVLCVFLMVVLTVPCFSLMLKLSLEELTSNADLIAAGKVVEKECMWGERGKWIYTYVTLAVDEYIKGEGEEQVIVKHLGGEVGKRGLIVGNMPSFGKDEEVLIFLRKSEDRLTTSDVGGRTGTVYEVSGLAQGKYQILTDENGKKIVRNNFSNLFIQDADGMKIIHEEVLSGKALSEFILEIEEALEEEM